MNKQSNLFQEVSIDIIKKIFKNALKETLIWEAKLLDGGMFNTNYYVEYGALHKKAVLRLGPINRHLITGFEQNLMNAETYVYSICKNIGIPCSTVLSCDTSKSIIDRDFMIVEFIESVVMLKAQLTQQQRNKLYFEIGQYLSKLHQVSANSFGFVSRICDGKTFNKWSEALIYELNDISNRLLELKGLNIEQYNRLLSKFYESKELLDQITQPHLLHTDLWEGNVLLDKETLEIVAIIDSDRAVFGDCDFEFASPWMEHEALTEGYGSAMQKPFTNDRVKRRHLYQIFFSLLDAYVGYAEYNNLELYENSKRNLINLVNK